MPILLCMFAAAQIFTGAAVAANRSVSASTPSAAPVIPRDKKWIRCAIHVHTLFSGHGKYGMETVVQMARKSGLDAVVFTDDLSRKWEYGLWPFRWLIKKTVEENSILKFGPEKYLAEISRLQMEYPDIALIPGAEVAPFYWWSGNPFRKNLVLHDWNIHMVVLGLYSPELYKALPAAGGNADPFSNFRYEKPSLSDPWRAYRMTIDAAINSGALVFWAHPDAKNWAVPTQVGPVKVQSEPYPDALIETRGFTGFAVLFEGKDDCGRPGGTWDQALMNGLAEKRKIWAIGELDFSDPEKNGVELYTVQTVARRPPPVGSDIAARHYEIKTMIAAGKCYALRRPVDHQLLIDELPMRGAPLKISSSDGKPRKVALRIVRDGKLLQERRLTLPASVEWPKEVPGEAPVRPPSQGSVGYRHYLRYEIFEDAGSRIFTNPVFW